jgi:uncharacterized protein (DUF433 family)
MSLTITLNHALHPTDRRKNRHSDVVGPTGGDVDAVFAFQRIGVRISERLPEKGRLMPHASAVVHSDPEILGGTPVFNGTRVPFRNLIDYLERGYSLEEFLDAFPSVTREQVVASLEAANEAMSVRARSPR